MTLVSDTLATCNDVKKPRTTDNVFKYMMTEVGELAMEMAINEKFANREAGDDGVIGEAIDVIVCALDLIYLENPDITEEEINSIARAKLAKWKATST